MLQTFFNTSLAIKIIQNLWVFNTEYVLGLYLLDGRKLFMFFSDSKIADVFSEK